jgi:hypothetical protein
MAKSDSPEARKHPGAGVLKSDRSAIADRNAFVAAVVSSGRVED